MLSILKGKKRTNIRQKCTNEMIYLSKQNNTDDYFYQDSLIKSIIYHLSLGKSRNLKRYTK